MGYSEPQTRWAVVTLPTEIDATNARQAGKELRDAVVPGVTTVIADLTATTFCDSSGIQMLALVHQLAMANRTKLVLVVRSAAVRRILALTGLDSLLPVYPSLAGALSPGTVPEAEAAR